MRELRERRNNQRNISAYALKDSLRSYPQMYPLGRSSIPLETHCSLLIDKA